MIVDVVIWDHGDSLQVMTTLCLHSSGLSGRQWNRLVAALPGVCVVPDLIGYPDGPEWIGGAALVPDLQRVIEILDSIADPVDLVGHSYGGSLAILAALQRPDRIRRLVVHEPVLWGVLASDAPDTLDGFFDRFDTSEFFDLETGGNRVWLESFVDFWGGLGAWQAMSEAMRNGFLHVGRKVFREVYDLSYERTSSATYDVLSMPTLVTMGTESPVEERMVCRLLVDRKPNREFRSFSCGHMGPVTHPHLINPAIVAFLNQD